MASFPYTDEYVRDASGGFSVRTAPAEYLPASHSMQTEAPAAEYLPAPQIAQVEATVAPTAAENLPAGQSEQVDEELAPITFEYVPAAQSKHAAEPGSSLYVPPGHAEQGPPCGPVNAALQVQLLRRVLPAGEEEPSGHEMQSDERDGPSLYVSAGQRVQGPYGSIWQR